MNDTSQTETPSRFDKILSSVINEYIGATGKFGNFASTHEGYAVILEELDELWDEIKLKTSTQAAQFAEAKQVAAMAIRFMMDCCEDVDL